VKTTIRRRLVQLAISGIVAGSCVWVLHAGALPVIPPSSAFAGMRWWTVPAYVGLWSVVHSIRALRWHWLLLPIRRVRPGLLLGINFVSFGAILLFPLRSGEILRPVLLQRRAGVSGWAATGTVAAERIADGLCLSLLLLTSLKLAGPVASLPDRVGDLPVRLDVIPAAARATLMLFLVAFAIMAAFYWRREQACRLTERAVGILSRPLARWISERVARTAEGLGFLPSARYSAPFFSATAVYWLLNAACTWLLAWGSGFDGITYWQACVVMGVLALGFLVPNAPGFFGAFQLSLYAGLLLYFSPALVESTGAAFVLLLYACQLGIQSLAALGALALGAAKVRDLSESTANAAEPAETLAE
jgi:hypothetical protein